MKYAWEARCALFSKKMNEEYPAHPTPNGRQGKSQTNADHPLKLVFFNLPPEFDPLLLPANRSPRRNGQLPYRFRGDPSAKHALEALGVPHTEVARLQVDGRPAGLGHLLHDGERLLVESAESPASLPRPTPGEPVRFVADNHLGKLVTYLRLLGFDCLYEPDLEDETLASISSEQQRVLLTRDRQLLMRRIVEYGCWVRSKTPEEQVRQVLRRYDLFSQIQPFLRCLRCNHLLEPVAKELILDRLEPLTRRYYDDFRRCPHCDQIYWAGSHYDHMRQFIDQVLRDGAKN
jgi:uncharacterized protein with PIN domain